MPDGARSIIIGGGIAALLPFTTGRVTFISDDDPPTVGAMSVAAFSLGTGGVNPAMVISSTPDTDPQPSASERLRVKGGAIIEGVGTDSVAIGRGASAPAGDTVAIGRGASAGGGTGTLAVGALASTSTTGDTAIGNGATATGNLSTAVGASASANGGGGTGLAIAVGNGASAVGVRTIAIGGVASATAAVCVGTSSTSNAIGTIVMGSSINANGNANNIYIMQGGFTGAAFQTIVHGGTPTNISSGATGLVLIGGGTTTVTHANNIIVGRDLTSFAARVAIIGNAGSANGVQVCVIGGGNEQTATLGGLTIRCTNGVTTANLAMGDLTIVTPLGTGNAANGRLNLQSGVVQAAGATQHTARTGAAVQASATAADTDLLVFDVDNALLERVTVGAANSGGAGFKLLRIPN